jgi:serine/threonine-protein kinase
MQGRSSEHRAVARADELAGDDDRLVIPGYEIIAKLSSGGMGEILLAHRRSSYGFGKLFAIKTMRSDKLRRKDLRAMFLDEARLVARLDHPAVAQVYDFGEVEDTMYFAMEYVAGITFRKLIRTKEIPLPPAICARLIADACLGLHAAHELTDIQGHPLHVVHRDVSPVNLMLTYQGSVKLLDFGIAMMREREAPATAVGVLKGKLAYMSPEQRLGLPVDRRTDVYSASIVLYELLTRKRLFSGDGDFLVNWVDLTKNVAPPSTLVGPLPAGLDEILLKGLSYDAGDRFQDMRQLATELERVFDDARGETLHTFSERELRTQRVDHTNRMLALMTSSSGAHVGPMWSPEMTSPLTDSVSIEELSASGSSDGSFFPPPRSPSSASASSEVEQMATVQVDLPPLEETARERPAHIVAPQDPSEADFNEETVRVDPEFFVAHHDTVPTPSVVEPTPDESIAVEPTGDELISVDVDVADWASDAPVRPPRPRPERRLLDLVPIWPIVLSLIGGAAIVSAWLLIAQRHPSRVRASQPPARSAGATTPTR